MLFLTIRRWPESGKETHVISAREWKQQKSPLGRWGKYYHFLNSPKCARTHAPESTRIAPHTREVRQHMLWTTKTSSLLAAHTQGRWTKLGWSNKNGKIERTMQTQQRQANGKTYKSIFTGSWPPLHRQTNKRNGKQWCVHHTPHLQPGMNSRRKFQVSYVTKRERDREGEHRTK